jgi:NADH-quinone oxidoreductase subunit N
MLFNINALLEGLSRDSLAFLPELLVCGVIVLLLLLRLFPFLDRLHLGWLALLATLAILGVGCCQWVGECSNLLTPEQAATDGKPLVSFTGMLVYDRLTLFIRLFLLGFTALIIWLSMLTGIPDREDSADFYCLLLGAMLGMMLMASANHLLMIYLAVEMASLPSYALAGFLKGRRQSSEAALKYVVYGGGAAGVMLYGISLLAGKFGTAYLPDVAVAYVTAIYPPNATKVVFDPILVLGTLFIMIGIAFKLSAVPFHFWCPDVFEGAAAEVAGFLSVASKGAALAMLARVSVTLAGVDPLVSAASHNWMHVAHYLIPALAFFAALTATFGNLAAYLQTNLKRLLAYSTIAHAGYMMMGLATLTKDGLSAVLFYLIAYLFMNLGAFGVVAFLRNQTGSEDLSDFRGLVRRSPWMVITLSIFLLSLLGIPPLVGFVAKFQVFAALFEGGKQYSNDHEVFLSQTLYVLLAIGALNTVLSAVYYIKVMKVMIIDSRAEDVEGEYLHSAHEEHGAAAIEAPREPRPQPAAYREPAGSVFFATVMSLVILGLGVVPAAIDGLVAASKQSTERFASRPGLETTESRQ